MRLTITLFLGFNGLASAACPSQCSGHGDCGEHDVCTCWNYWTGADCSLRSCPYGVSWQTASDEQLRDAATPNYPEGFRAYAECSDRGICDQSIGQCSCFDGFAGKGCRRSACSNKCSGHGRCVFDAEVDRDNYWNDGLLHNQKQYWNGYKTQQCVCDRGWWGYDCSLRLCPEGQKGAADLNCVGDFINDVQMVTVTFNDLSITNPENIEQFFSLEFTDMFSGKYTTRPISFFDDSRVVQEALISLPDNSLPDIEVLKVFPLAGFAANGTGEGKHEGVAGTGDQCAQAYHNYFVSTTCQNHAECDAMFPTLAGVNNVFCESEIHRCIETDGNCQVTPVGSEFTSDPPCAFGFEPTGVYNPMGAPEVFWGRQLTPDDRRCAIGTFPQDDPVYTRPGCATDADCKSCSPWTNAVAGFCDTNTSQCAASPEYAAFLAEASGNNCHVVSFLVVFSHSSTPGEQELLKCNVGQETDFDGATPRFASDQLQCDVTRVSKNMWRSAITDQQLCFKEGASGYGATFEDYDETRLTCQDGTATSASFGVDEMNTLIKETNYVLTVQEMVDATLDAPGQQLFESTTFTTPHSEFIPSSPCSAQGDCDVIKGVCTCAEGYEGDACQDLTDFS